MFGLGLSTLSHDRLTEALVSGDMIELYKMMTGNMTVIVVCGCIYVLTQCMLVTRGNNFKLVPQHCRYDFRKYYFTIRVVPIWNSLHNDVVMADNITLFNKCLDKFWSSYDFVYLSFYLELNHLGPEVQNNFT